MVETLSNLAGLIRKRGARVTYGELLSVLVRLASKFQNTEITWALRSLGSFCRT